MNTVIIVSFFPPYPALRGNRRVLSNLCAWLRKNGYRVVLVLQMRSLPEDHVAIIEAMVDELWLVGQPDDGAERGASVVQTLIRTLLRRGGKVVELAKRLAPRSLKSSWVRQQRLCWPRTRRLVAELAAANQPAAVITEYLYLNACFTGLPDSVLKLTHTIDMLSRVQPEVLVHGVDSIGSDVSVAEERAALLLGDVIIALQAREAALFRALVPEREVIVLGYAPARIAAAPSQAVKAGRVLMVGGEHEMNRRGLQFLVHEVWPQVSAALPRAVLCVAGEVGRFLPAGAANVEVLGVVDRLEEEYARAAVLVNPVDLGTGLKVKTVEALCHGKALVTTPVGVEGLAAEGEEDLPCLVAADWPGFAAAVIALLRDDEKRQQLERQAIHFARRHFSEEAVFAGLAECLAAHFQRHARP